MTISDATDESALELRDGSRSDPRPVGMDRLVWIAALLDAIVIVVFVTIGRSSHEEGITVAGVASTAWPFLVGALAGWLVGRVWQRPVSLVPGALAVWLGAFVVGMALRVVSSQGTAVSFMIVACSFLAATLFGWRLVFAGVRRLQQRAGR